jgi:hypothetical protein
MHSLLKVMEAHAALTQAIAALGSVMIAAVALICAFFSMSLIIVRSVSNKKPAIIGRVCFASLTLSGMVVDGVASIVGHFSQAVSEIENERNRYRGDGPDQEKTPIKPDLSGHIRTDAVLRRKDSKPSLPC